MPENKHNDDTEDQLQEALSRLDLITRSAKIGIWDWDILKNEWTWDDRMYEILGLTRRDYPKAHDAWMASAHPDDCELGAAMFQNALDGENKYNLQYTAIWPDGSKHYLKAYGVVSRDDTGQPVRVMGISYDITERVLADLVLQKKNEEIEAQNEEYLQLNEELAQANEELMLATEKARENEETYRMLYNSINDALFTSEVDENGNLGKFVLVNDVACERLGYTREELLNKTPFDINSDRMKKTLADRVKRIINQKNVIVEAEHQAKDGRIIPVEISTNVLRFKGKTIFQSVARDITERKKSEAALAQSQRLLQATFDQSNVPMVLITMPGAIISIVNDALREFVGITDEPSPVGTPLLDYVPSYQDYDPQGIPVSIDQAPIARALSGEKTVNQERYIVRKDGTIRWQLVNGTPIYNTAGELIAALLVISDITERKQAEADLLKSEERLRIITAHTPDHIVIQDKELRYRLVINPQLGFTETDMLGKTDFDFLQMDEAEKLANIKKSVIEKAEPYEVEVPLINVNGKTEYFSGVYVPKHDSHGMVDGLIGYFRNTTERKRLEEELQKTQRLESLARIIH